MPINYYPRPAEILLCDYGNSAIHPEMVKRRPVVVVSPRLRQRGELVGVVPLSTTEPGSIDPHHCRIELAAALPPPFDSAVMWAKCDMFSSVSRSRLDRFRGGRKAGMGSRVFVSGKVDAVQLKALRAAILSGLGLGSLTVYL